MKIAVIADIHSNIDALEAVLKDIREKNADLTVCVGDLVGYSPFPNEVIDAIRSNNILTIMGNYDDAVGHMRIVCGCDYPDPKDAERAGISLHWTITHTTEENLAYLASLPLQMTLTFEGKSVTFVHGSPRQLNEYLRENSEAAAEVMSSFAGDILVCGHTHVPYYKAYGEKLLVNAGSVGKPKTGNPRANYVIINLSAAEVKLEIIEVPYDAEKAALAIEESGLPKEFAEMIRTGKA